MQSIDIAYRTLVHAINYLWRSDPDAAKILESARREVFDIKRERTKYAFYSQQQRTN